MDNSNSSRILRMVMICIAIVMLCCDGYVIANDSGTATSGPTNMIAQGTILKSKTLTATVGNDLTPFSLQDNGTHFILGGLFTVTGSPYSPPYSYDLFSNLTIINATWKGSTTLYFAAYAPPQNYLTVNNPSGGSLNATSGWYYNGTQISILATPNNNYAFQYINVDGVNYTSNPYALTMSANHTVKAYFRLVAVTWNLTVNAPSGGTINQTSATFTNGTTVGLLATPNNNYTFLNWQIDGVNSTSNPTSVLMSSNHTISAYFNLKQYYLTIITDGNEAVNQSSGWFTNGTVVGILATPNSNYHFTNFTVDGSLVVSNPTSIMMTSNHTVYVYSSLIQYYLAINMPSNGAINQTSGWFTNGTNVAFLASPNNNYAFQCINVDGVNYTSNPYTIVMNGNHTVTAYFTPIQYHLTVILDDHETINQTSGWFTNSTTVGILATPNSNYYFTNFTVDGSLVSSNPTTVLMTANHTVYVFSSPLQFYLAINSPMGGNMNVTSGWYINGTRIFVMATANSNYAFSNYNLDGTNSSGNPIMITMTANHTISAYFNLIQYYLTVDAPSNGNMNATSGWYTNGTVVPVLAAPNLNYAFLNFALDGTNSSTNPISITMTSNHTLDTYFSLIQYYLTVTLDGCEMTNQSSAWFTNGTTVGIFATPNQNYYFTNFTSDGSLVPSNPTSVLMTANHTVNVYSSLLQFYLSITDNGHGSENATSGWYANGTTITILSTPSLNYYFANYALDSANGTANPLSITMTANHTVSYYDYLLQYYLTVDAPSNGNVNATSGWYTNGTVIKVQAATNNNYQFLNFALDGSNSTNNPLTITMTSNHTLSTYYSLIQYYLTVIQDSNEAVNQTSAWFTNGTIVGILATPNINYHFTNFTVDGSLVALNPASVLMISNHTVRVYSSLSQYYLTINAPSNGAINQTSAWFTNGTVVNLLAIPNSNYAFQCINVDGVNYTSNPYTLTMTSNHTVSAYFNQIQYYLTINAAVNGNVNQTSGWLANGTKVGIFASPNNNYAFQCINVDGVNYTSNPYTMTMTANHTITAYFTLIQYYLTMILDGNEITNRTSAWFTNGTTVGILATPNSNYHFTNFTVDGSSVTSNPTSVVMTSNHTVYVYSSLLQYYLTINIPSNGNANVTSAWYTNGTTVSVLATPNSNYQFLNFALDGTNSSTNPITIVVNSNHTLSTYFSLVRYYLTINPLSNGNVNASSGWYTNGTSVSVLASPNNNYAFLNFALDGTNSSSNPLSIMMTANHTLNTYFYLMQYYLKIIGDGNEAVNQTSAWFTNGTSVGILATPNLNYHFTNFTIDGSLISSNPTSALMTANHTVRVYSSLIQYYLTTNTPMNGIINQTSVWFSNGTTISLLATPNSNYAFLNWQIDGVNSTANPISITMTQNHTVSAYFTQIQYYLTIIPDGNEVINQTSTWFINGTNVSILATPNTNYYFTNFTIDGVLMPSNPAFVLMTANHTVYAYASSLQYYLAIASSSGGSVNATSVWYANGTVLYIQATPANNYLFSGFTLDGSNTYSNPIAVTMTANHTISAAFSLLQYYLTVSPPTGGTLNVASGWYANGTKISVQATPASNYAFQYITVDGVNYASNLYTITMTSAHTVSAVFTPIQSTQYYLNVISDGNEAVNQTSGWLASGTSVGILATAHDGYQFANFTVDGALVSSDPTSVVMNSNHTVYVYSSPVQYYLTVDPTLGGVVNATSGWYANDTVLNVSATADYDYAFSNFDLDGSNSSGNPITITMTVNHTLDTYFNIVEYYLTVGLTSNGTVNQTSGWYPYGSIIGLSALPDSGYAFSIWVIDGATNSSMNPLSITMDMNHTVNAYFSASQDIWVDRFHVVSNNPFDTDPFVPENGSWVVANPYDNLTLMGSGFITIQDTIGLPPEGQFQVQVNGSDWQYSVDTNASEIILSYIPGPGFSTVAILFNDTGAEQTQLYYLTIIVNGSGSVNQTSGWFGNGTPIHLWASADEYNSFLNWSLDNENSSDNPLTVTMDSNHTVIAYLTSYNYLVTTSNESILSQIANFKPFWVDLILVIALVCYLCYSSINNNLKRKGARSAKPSDECNSS